MNVVEYYFIYRVMPTAWLLVLYEARLRCMPKDDMIFTSSYRHVVNRGARAMGQFARQLFAGVLTVKIVLDTCQKCMKQHLRDPGFKNFRRRNHIAPYRVSRLQHSNAFLMILPRRLSLLGYILSRKFTFRFHCLVFFLYNSTFTTDFWEVGFLS